MLPALRFLLSLGAALVLSVCAVGAAPEAVLHTGPGATLDGTAAFDGMRVFPGQVLRAPADQSSELLLAGNSIQLAPGSSSTYRGDSADLISGTIALATSTQFSVHSGCMTAHPLASGSARYTVELKDRILYVTVQSGQVSVSSKRSVTVSARKSAAIHCEAPQQDIVLSGSHLPPKVFLGTAAAAAPAGALAIRTRHDSTAKQDLSAESPSQR
jgi:hypothetical protein